MLTLAALCALSGPAPAADAIWLANPADGDFNNAANWDGGVVPDGTATFAASAITSLSSSAWATVGGFTFNAGAYSFTNNGGLEFNGTGIAVNAGSLLLTTNNGINFRNSSTAGATSIVNNSTVTFYDLSSAGAASITTNLNLSFRNQSTAGNASIHNTYYVFFYEDSTAGNASITNDGQIYFYNASTAGDAHITGNGPMYFTASSNAANATITLGAEIIFDNSSSAGHANITLNGGYASFADQTTADHATITTNGHNLVFGGASTAASATINGRANFGGASTAGSATINGGASFYDSSTAADAAIANSTESYFQQSSTAANAAIANTHNLYFYHSSTGGNAAIANDTNGNLWFYNSSTAGHAAIVNSASSSGMGFTNSSSAGSATIANSGFLQIAETATLANANIENLPGATLLFTESSTAGNATIANGGVVDFRDSNAAGSATILNNGDLWFRNTSSAGNATVTTGSGGLTHMQSTATLGAARFITQAGGTLDISGLSSAGTTAGSIEGAGDHVLGDKNLEVGANGLSTEVSGAITGVGGSLTKAGSGTLTLSGTNAYTGATVVNAGTLAVNSALTATSGITVNGGGRLGGTGTVGSTSIAGGTLAPGNSIGTLTVQGDLTFAPGSTYEVELSGASADRANVTGTAALDGTLHAVFLPGSSLVRSYTLLTADGGLGGSTFDDVTTANLPSAFSASLAYGGNDVTLSLTASLPASANAGRNPRNAATAITDYFNGGGALPAPFVTVAGLTGEALDTALAQLSGEAGTAAQAGALQASSRFMGLMFAPRAGGPLDSSLTFGLAPAAEVAAVPIAYALGESFDPFGLSTPQRWSVWASTFGGTSHTGADAATGSHALSAHAFGFAMGLDYRAAPDALIGMAFSGGNSSWSLADGLGGGQSRDYQLGLNAAMRKDDIYAAASLAYGLHQMSTERYVLGDDRLTAGFDAHSLGGRLEGGARFVADNIGITPYAAVQAQTFLTPSYGEDDPGGSGFGLSYDERLSASVRGEFGSRFDHALTLSDGKRLNLNARLAYAHDWTIGSSALATSFQALPGSSFTVNAASPPEHLALVSLGGELFLDDNLSLGGRFDGEFSGASSSFAGTGSFRVSW